jgi:uncharacterized protein with NAD-binding domain and iron-sulfur cluster
MPTQPIRVAIIGGGCASLTTAFELTRPEHDGRFEVTVYQMGWRLGGKGASGRGPSDRIEEHGLHLWLGFYENAFSLMRECYAERAAHWPDRRFRDWREAFSPAHDVAIADQTGDGSWEFWVAHFPPGDGLPGDPVDRGGPFTVTSYLRQALSLLVELLRSADLSDPADHDITNDQPDGAATTGGIVDATLRYGRLAVLGGLYQAAETLRALFEAWVPPAMRDAAQAQLLAIESLAAGVRIHLESVLDADPTRRRVWIVADLILAILRGATLHGLALDPRGFDAINDYDWRDWLLTHGASRRSVDSGFMRGIYDLAFAYEDGDVSRPRLAAGVALRGAMRMFFTYRGALFWRMNAGMGDVVFAPLYDVLKARGVRFEFFHRLRNICLSPASAADGPSVDALEFDVQARIKGGGEYQPLVDVRGLPAWPATPDYSQLVGGDRLRRERREFEALWDDRRADARTLRVTRDFDFVVLGVGGGAVPFVAGELLDRDARWRDMVRHVKSVPTQCFQLWLDRDATELGWRHPPVNLSGFVEPFDTWADMSHLIPEESFASTVRSIAYFCSVLPDTMSADGPTAAFAAEQHTIARANAVRFLERDVAALWPSLAGPDGFRWESLVSSDVRKRRRGNRSDNHHGPDRFDEQFCTANVNPSDRYVLSLPGTLRYRISPLDRTYDNLTIAGDWTASGLDSGCIESAVISGRLAAHALSQYPALESIVGYDHP